MFLLVVLSAVVSKHHVRRPHVPGTGSFSGLLLRKKCGKKGTESNKYGMHD